MHSVAANIFHLNKKFNKVAVKLLSWRNWIFPHILIWMCDEFINSERCYMLAAAVRLAYKRPATIIDVYSYLSTFYFTFWVHFFGMIWNVISDPRSLVSLCINIPKEHTLHVILRVISKCGCIKEQFTYPSFSFTHWNHFDDRIIKNPVILNSREKNSWMLLFEKRYVNHYVYPVYV